MKLPKINLCRLHKYCNMVYTSLPLDLVIEQVLLQIIKTTEGLACTCGFIRKQNIFIFGNPENIPYISRGTSKGPKAKISYISPEKVMSNFF